MNIEVLIFFSNMKTHPFQAFLGALLWGIGICWSQFMVGNRRVEQDIVLFFAGAGCFSIWGMSVVLSFCYIKKRHCCKQDRYSQQKLHIKLLSSEQLYEAERSENLYPLCCGMRAPAYLEDNFQLFQLPWVSFTVGTCS